MTLRSKVQREDRRRRILRDEAASATETESAPVGSKPATGRTYSDAAVASVQLRLADLVPYRVWSLWIWWLVGMVGVAVVPALYAYQQTGGRWASGEELVALFPFGVGTVAAWLASTFLAFASVLAGMIFFVRRHKQDDYRGRYGLWLWASGALMLGSLDASTGLHQLIRCGIERLTPAKLYGDGSLWWILVLTAVGLVLALQIVLDGRRSWGTCVSLLMAMACYAGAAILYLNLWDFSAYGRQAPTMAQGGLLLWGHQWLMFSMLVQTRFVVMDAQGMVAARPAKKGRRPKKVPTNVAERRAPVQSQTTARKRAKVSAEPPAKNATSPSSRPKGAPGRSTTANGDEEDEDRSYEDIELELLTDPSISKADRKRLKKELRRQKRAA